MRAFKLIQGKQQLLLPFSDHKAEADSGVRRTGGPTGFGPRSEFPARSHVDDRIDEIWAQLLRLGVNVGFLGRELSIGTK
jgi:hypothetical protein